MSITMRPEFPHAPPVSGSSPLLIRYHVAEGRSTISASPVWVVLREDGQELRARSGRRLLFDTRRGAEEAAVRANNR